ncbi:PqqD family protein [bacterium]|nr:PqqD family protein [bacterium]
MTGLSLDSVCSPSGQVAAREIEGEVLLVPLFSDGGDADEDFYTLNETARSIWLKLDGRRTLSEVAALVADEFDVPASELQTDLVEFIGDLTRRHLLIVKGTG